MYLKTDKKKPRNKERQSLRVMKVHGRSVWLLWELSFARLFCWTSLYFGTLFLKHFFCLRRKTGSVFPCR